MSAADYQVLAFHDTAPLRQVGFYAQEPLTLDVRGASFVGVVAVYVNGTPSPEFIVLSTTRLLAQVPNSEKNAQLTNVRVVLSRSGLTQTSVIDLDAVVPGARATGFTKLMQAFLRVLFTNPGDDLEYPWLGGGLSRLIGAAGTPSELRAQASAAISTAAQHLVRLQTQNPVLTDAERLRSATLLLAEYDQATTAVQVRVTLTAVDGTTGNPTVSL